MNNALSRDFGVLSLLKFAAPTVVMMVFMSLYTMVDGVFVSNLVGEDALSAVNIVYPALSVVMALSIMLGTGGSAVIARTMGEGKPRQAKEQFSLLVAVGILIGVALMAVGLFLWEPIIGGLGATARLHDYCRDYLRPLAAFTPMGVLQMLFQTFFITAGKPKLGLVTTMAGGVANVLLDWLFIGPLDWGISGAAIATGIGWSIPALYGLFYFALKRSGTLCFVRPKWDGGMLLRACGNGSSEMVSNLAGAIITFLFNFVMLRYLGEAGVAAITIVLYAQFLLTAVYLGFSSGVAPVISYNYGEGNVERLRKIFKICAWFIVISSVVIFAAAMLAAGPIVSCFVRPDSPVYQVAHHGFLLFGICYLFIGCNIFASSLFTSLSNGRVSAVISFLRTFVFIVAAILLLPYFIEADGVWLAVPAAEFLTLAVSLFFIAKGRHIYHYL